MDSPQSKPRPAIQFLDKGEMRLAAEGGELAVVYRLHRSRRARHLRLTINRHNEVVLTLPAGCTPERGLAFMKTKTEWLRRHLLRAQPPETLSGFLQARGFLAMDGAKVVIDWQRPTGRPGLRYDRRNGKVVFDFDPERNEEGQLKSLLRQCAATALPRRTLNLAAVHALAVNRISVRDQISRWGSCSAGKNVSLNWRLLLLPPEIQDYVIWHELAHLVELNHSSRFWTLLERFDPLALVHDKTLSRITNHVMGMGREASA